MKVLIACEESQRVCTAFREKGHEAFSCDIIECSGGHPEWHIQGDVLKVLNPTTHYGWISEDEAEWCGIEFNTVDGSYHRIEGKWDLIIAHPPCTYFSTAGANWLFRGGELNLARYEKGLQMKQLFMDIWNADCDRICIENVVAMKIWQLPVHTQEIQPFQFGDPFSKKTRLWLKNLAPLIPTKIVRPESKWISCGYKKRKLQNNAVCKAYNNNRSKTFPGIAKAMAEQWG